MRYQRISATWQSVIGLWRRGLVVREGASATRALHPLPSTTPVQSDIPTFHPFNPMSYRHAMGKRLLTALRIMKFCPLPPPTTSWDVPRHEYCFMSCFRTDVTRTLQDNVFYICWKHVTAWTYNNKQTRLSPRREIH